MRALALDTTISDGSVALIEDDRAIAERRGDPLRPHAERLPRDIMTLLETRGLRIGDIDLFAVASGPGSFTGLRIGIATIQGLAFVTGRPALGVSALDALAHAASADAEPGTIVAAWMDAHRREVFSALYRVTERPRFDPDRLDAVETASVGDPAATLERCMLAIGRVDVFAGDGAVRYADLIRMSRFAGARVIDPAPLASAIGRLAIRRAQRGEAVPPGAIRPLYVRRPDAEIDRDRKLERLKA